VKRVSVSGREELRNGNRETWYGAFIAPDSLFCRTLRTYRRRRRQYPELFTLPEHAHLRVVRLGSPGETEQWLAGVRDIKLPLHIPDKRHKPIQ
jgi:hypothetical protein